MSLQTRIKAAGAAAAAAPVDAGRHRAVKRRTKRAVMDRMGYDEVARISAYVDSALARSELRPAVEAALNVEEPTDLATPEREIIVDEILDDVVGLGPLQPLIEDDTVTEIMINGCRSAFFERSGVLHPIEHAFEDDEQIRVLIDRIISPLGRRVDERSPIVNARLKTGYRVNAVIPPVAIDGQSSPSVSSRTASAHWTSLWGWGRCRFGMRSCCRARCRCDRTWRLREARDLVRPPCSTRCHARFPPASAS